METMSTAAAQPEYAALLARTLPSVIHSEKENERCIATLEKLDGKAEKLTVAERRLAELLTVLIEDFENEAYGLKQKDMLDIFITPSIASEVLNGKRGLTVEHIRRLIRRFHVSPEVFF